ncbi:MAG TPA: epimerase [Anaeromyxobacteraceae bacterium]|nr:epimerase [Anaeromyxobacteraceae bacterium]
MNVLVIGGNRFVGLLATWRLLAAGHRVALLNRGRRPDPFGDRVERLRGDRGTDLERLTAGRSFDVVMDLACYSGEDGRRAGKIFRGRVGHYLMVSTGQVYLVRERAPRPARERDYPGPVLPRPAGPPDLGEWEYGVGKRDAEDALAEACREGFPATRVRIPMVNGELDYFRRIESYLWRLLDGGPMLVPDGGAEPVRHVYGPEVARFLVETAGRAETFGEAYNLAQEEAPTLYALLEKLRELLGSRSPLVRVPASALLSAGLEPVAVSPFSGRWMSFLDPSRARDELGFRHLALDAYLGRIAASFLAHAPPDPPEGYRHRERERELARRLHGRDGAP